MQAFHTSVWPAITDVQAYTVSGSSDVQANNKDLPEASVDEGVKLTNRVKSAEHPATATSIQRAGEGFHMHVTAVGR